MLAAKWRAPRLTRFYAAHPGVPLRIDASVELAYLDASDIDAGLRVGTGPWPNVRAERLAGLDLFPVCSAALAERIQGVDDLRNLPAIRDRGSPGRWRQWLAGQGTPDLPLGGGPVYSDAALCLEAAIAGQGVALAWPTLAVDALRSGCLSGLPAPRRLGQSVALVTPTARSCQPSAPSSKAAGQKLRLTAYRGER